MDGQIAARNCYITLHNYKNSGRRNGNEGLYRYRTRSSDFDACTFIETENVVTPYIDMADDEVLTPCIMRWRNNENKPYYDGYLLIPPGIDRDSKLFSQNLGIPLVELYDVVGPDHNPTGYVLRSADYLGPQRLYMRIKDGKRVEDLENGSIFQAVLRIPRSEKAHIHPFVSLIGPSNKGDIVRQNKAQIENMKKLLSSGKIFWWNNRKLGR
jgi:hypothetical protein